WAFQEDADFVIARPENPPRLATHLAEHVAGAPEETAVDVNFRDRVDPVENQLPAGLGAVHPGQPDGFANFPVLFIHPLDIQFVAGVKGLGYFAKFLEVVMKGSRHAGGHPTVEPKAPGGLFPEGFGRPELPGSIQTVSSQL